MRIYSHHQTGGIFAEKKTLDKWHQWRLERVGVAALIAARLPPERHGNQGKHNG